MNDHFLSFLAQEIQADRLREAERHRLARIARTAASRQHRHAVDAGLRPVPCGGAHGEATRA